MEESFDAQGKRENYFELTHEINCSPFRRALIFKDGASDKIAATVESSLNTLGFQVHCNQLDSLIPTTKNSTHIF
jgi:hypothetical protein